MQDIVAKAMAVITGILLLATLAILFVTSRPPAGTREVVAEFQDAFPMLEGQQVRTYGAISGSIGPIEVNDKGLAEVTLLVDSKLPAPTDNAVATIKQADTTGDSYVAYDPGDGSGPLADVDGKPTIECDAPAADAPCRNTLAAPRFDDLINAFGAPEQAGVKLILQSLSTAVAERGDDVNRAALELVPALTAANQALAEVNSQNTALKSFITNMENVSGQAAARREQLGEMIESLDDTLQVTAGKTQPLDAGIAGLPQTQRRLQEAMTSLTRAADATQPLASELAATAPGLTSLLDKAPGFVDDLRFAVRQGVPTLELTRRLLAAGAPTIKADPQRLVTGAFDLAPALSNLLKGILGGDETIKAFFGDDADGAAESRPDFGYGLGAIASERGNLPGYPADWADRRALRLGGILSCETFGISIGPGCLANLLAARSGNGPTPQRSRPRPASAPAAPAPAAGSLPVLTKPADEQVDYLKQAVDQTLGGVLHVPKAVVKKLGDDLGVPPESLPAANLLDLLLGDG